MICIKEGHSQLVAHILFPLCNLLRIRREDIREVNPRHKTFGCMKKQNLTIFQFNPAQLQGKYPQVSLKIFTEDLNPTFCMYLLHQSTLSTILFNGWRHQNNEC